MRVFASFVSFTHQDFLAKGKSVSVICQNEEGGIDGNFVIRMMSWCSFWWPSLRVAVLPLDGRWLTLLCLDGSTIRWRINLICITTPTNGEECNAPRLRKQSPWPDRCPEGGQSIVAGSLIAVLLTVLFLFLSHFHPTRLEGSNTNCLLLSIARWPDFSFSLPQKALPMLSVQCLRQMAPSVCLSLPKTVVCRASVSQRDAKLMAQCAYRVLDWPFFLFA